MDDLVVFLRARLDEEDRLAAACVTADGSWQARDGDLVTDDGTRFSLGEALAGHVARHDPAQTIRGVAARRSLLVLRESIQLRMDQAAAGDDGAAYSLARAELRVVHFALRLDAATYSAHPDYRRGWAPGR
ncbi:DUF6221 family protein [Streptomyces sp. NBC_01476]|uniref:DUF6221 family protein n=1 Tax=Streptomyces sp. NBC_01476 TaxID=2903881 RepID=UPI002E379594|nr:DUF6221 family protein [Streptomyces sp. NBC_01476]